MAGEGADARAQQDGREHEQPSIRQEENRCDAVGQDAAVNLGMQRDNAMTEDGRKPGEIGDIGDWNAGFSDDACRTTARGRPRG
jgi:hypothetical protein